MDDKIKHIIDSGLLESYFLGLTDEKQSLEISLLLESSPELRKRQEAFDELLIDMTDAVKVKPPDHMLSEIKNSLNEDSNFNMPKTKLEIVKESPSSIPNWILIAMGILLLMFAWVAYTNFNNSKNLSEDLNAVRKELKIQKIQNIEMSNQLSKLADEFAYVNNIETRKFVLSGNTKAKDLSLIAYWNSNEEKAMVAMTSFPDLPVDKCLQMWADVDGKMINLGILNADQVYTNIKFLRNATSLNITIEPKGGNDHPTVSDLIANVFI